MPSLSGVELHELLPFISPQPATSEFVRLVQFSNTLYTRVGIRGQASTLTVKHCESTHDARRHLAAHYAEYKSERALEVVFAGPLAAYLPGQFEHSDFDPEVEFLGQWTQSIVATVTGSDLFSGHREDERTRWVAVSGLLAERGRNHGADVLYDYLTARPHAIDASTDRLIGQTNRLPNLTHTPPKRGIHDITHHSASAQLQASLLCEITPECTHDPQGCTACSTRQAELLCFLARGRDLPNTDLNERISMGVAAKRLLHLGSTPDRVPASPAQTR